MKNRDTEAGDGRYLREIHAREGSSMIYVILLVTLMAVFSSGYMAISRYNTRAALNSRRYMEAQLTAKTIHSSYCQAVSNREAGSVQLLLDRFEEDCVQVREEYDEMLEARGGDEDEGEDEDLGEQEEERWERYLKHALGDKEYVLHGDSASLTDEAKGTAVSLTLSIKPLEETAYVHTKVKCNGYEFSLKADIVFDQYSSVVVDGPGPRRSRGKGRVYEDKGGVYRYYEDETTESSVH